MHALHLQQKYCRITPTSRNNTFKHFQEWLQDQFHGQPTDENFETALLEEGLYGATNELHPSSPPILCPTYSPHLITNCSMMNTSHVKFSSY